MPDRRKLPAPAGRASGNFRKPGIIRVSPGPKTAMPGRSGESTDCASPRPILVNPCNPAVRRRGEHHQISRQITPCGSPARAAARPCGSLCGCPPRGAVPAPHLRPEVSPHDQLHLPSPPARPSPKSRTRPRPPASARRGKPALGASWRTATPARGPRPRRNRNYRGLAGVTAGHSGHALR